MKRNDFLTKVGRGTPMGELLRCYWLPLLHSHELEPDGPPFRVRLLGESLVAFRDSAGRVGLLDHHCPHRRASLFYGRNEEGGLRCAYHGWKFAVDGKCLDMPGEAPDCPLQRKVRARAYPCRESNGVIWAYMGSRAGAALPPLPGLGWAAAPVERKTRLKYLRRCNWLQAMEGDFDSAHLGFLHSRIEQSGQSEGGDALRPIVNSDRRPLLEVADTPAGVMYGAARRAGTAETYWRVTQFHFPFYTSVPSYGGLNRLKIWVPMDDVHTMVWEANWTGERDLDERERAGVDGRVPPSGFHPDSDDWSGRGRFIASRENDYLIDRERQRTVNFSGMEDSTPVQDAAMQESMGPIVDRSREHLTPADAAIIRLRRRLETAAKELAAGGGPPGADQPQHYRSHGEQLLVGKSNCWQRGFAALMAAAYEERAPAGADALAIPVRSVG